MYQPQLLVLYFRVFISLLYIIFIRLLYRFWWDWGYILFKLPCRWYYLWHMCSF